MRVELELSAELNSFSSEMVRDARKLLAVYSKDCPLYIGLIRCSSFSTWLQNVYFDTSPYRKLNLEICLLQE